MPTTPIRKINIQQSGSATPVEIPLGGYAENILYDESVGAKNVKQALDDKASNTAFTGASSSAAGTAGIVPAPAAGDEEKYLKGDGTWAAVAGGVTSVNTKTGAVVLNASDVGAIATSAKGTANGVAELDANGKVPSSQLPSYVDDVVEAADFASLPATGETGKIYITLDDNKTYRWGGTAYTEISASLALGETESTAYRGDRGKTAYDHATESGKISSAVTEGLYKIAATAQGHIASTTAVTKSDITALGIPGEAKEYEATTTSIGSASAWNAGSVTNIAVNGDALDITIGTAPSLTITSTTVATGIQEKT